LSDARISLQRGALAQVLCIMPRCAALLRAAQIVASRTRSTHSRGIRMSKHRIVKLLIAASVALSGAGYAAQAAPGSAKVDAKPALQQRAQGTALIGAARSALFKNVGGAAPASPVADVAANTHRAYPPSCLGNVIPLGLWLNDPNRAQMQITLRGDPLSTDSTEQQFSEVDTVTVFRVPCSSSKSAVLVEIDRPSNADTSHYPVFPNIYGGMLSGTSAGPVPFNIRLADDPNTFFTQTYGYTPLPLSDVFIFENFQNSAVFDYNQSFVVYVDNLSGDANQLVQVTLSSYNSAQYPSASLSMPITGYLTGNWFDSNHSGEGIQTEIGEVEGTTTRFIIVAWYTYDSTGTPYWLFGSGGFTAGDRSVNISQVAYEAGGSFAGTGSVATPAVWGSMTVNFPDCNTLHFTYQSAAGLPAGVPTGNGSRTWTRLTQINGLSCQ
jgi:hypothetical protein